MKPLQRFFCTTAFFMLLGLQAGRAQIFLRVYNYRPTGDFGFAFKPTFSAELGYMPEFGKKRVRVCFSASFLKMKARQDVFPIYGVESGNGTYVLPGQQSFSKYNLIQLLAAWTWPSSSAKSSSSISASTLYWVRPQ